MVEGMRSYSDKDTQETEVIIAASEEAVDAETREGEPSNLEEAATAAGLEETADGVFE